MIRRIFLLLPFLASGVAAQDTLDTEPAELRRYTVEMIIFEYSQDVSTGSEVFVADPPPFEGLLADGSLDSGLESQPSVALPERAKKVRTPYEIVMLDRDDFSLGEVYGHLRRLGAYKPLLHFGWTQATSPEQKDEPRPLSSFVRTPAGLDGDLNLYLSRYLHLAVNLQLDAPSNRQQATRRSYDFEQASPVHYRIEEDRIFRNGELRYFDHPRFGVLAKITRVENDGEVAEALAEGQVGEGLIGEELLGD